MWSELVPQILPLFSYSTDQQSSFGSASASQAGGSAAEADDSAYWDLIYILYPETLDAVGQAILHQLVSSWKLLEAQLLVGRLASSQSDHSL